jgi:hypothetical protein
MDPLLQELRVMSDVSSDDLLRKEAALLDSGLKLQSQCLDLLLAEMQALAQVIPAAAAVPGPKTDAETEAGFDNMPV